MRRRVAQIGDLGRLAPLGRLADRLGQVDVMIAHRRDQFLAHAVGGAQPEFLRQLIEHVDGAGFGVGELDGLGDDGRKHLLEVERRVDRLRDLAERAQLADRLRQLAGALLDLVLQVGVGFLQPRAHVVELIGKAFELVAGLDRDALAKVAAADPAAPARSAWIGPTMRRARNIPASMAKTSAASSTKPSR